MISEQTIQQAVERLVALAEPSKIVLFGSCACGDETEMAKMVDAMRRWAGERVNSPL